MTLYLHVTGFGPFCGVETNPTTHLMERLSNAAPSSSPATSSLSDRLFACGCVLLSTSVLVVSGKAVDADLKSLTEAEDARQKHYPLAPNDFLLRIHFGVHGSATKVHVESTAWNEANFRCPDEAGWQPIKEPIDATAADSLQSGLPLQALIDEAALTCSTPALLSTDPGRFVCNYTYFRSLQRTAVCPRSDAVFVHVPPTQVLSLEKVEEFLIHFCQAARKQLCQ
mmetsp:Transcript_4299/g.10562  ORF Transcript_4299/g.10562 Transcript_4299/m.10562 type:complete len:226 (+) Transcript_4299:127-804(+)